MQQSGRLQNDGEAPRIEWIEQIPSPKSIQSEAKATPEELENILQRKLHDPRVLGISNFTEKTTAEICRRIEEPNRVCHVKRFRPKFDLLRFTEQETAGQGRIKPPG